MPGVPPALTIRGENKFAMGLSMFRFESSVSMIEGSVFTSDHNHVLNWCDGLVLCLGQDRRSDTCTGEGSR